MHSEYAPQTCEELARLYAAAGVHRPMRVERYDPGAVRAYEALGIAPAARARVAVRIEAFVGGGFAGQVYRVAVLAVEGDAIAGLEPGGVYAMKILVPPTGFNRRFRDAIYAAGFQGPFQLQVNPDAARAGALWQTLIRRGAKLRFGSERAVVRILATFVDPVLGSCGELSEWVDGRSWLLEVDDDTTALRRWAWRARGDGEGLGSPEFRAKRVFMRDFVELLHAMGAREFARQYEWWTLKSQPNCLKRNEAADFSSGGLTAVDFRPGLALLPFLPMSPGDVALIAQGLRRGSLVQFDRGDLAALAAFVEARRDAFADLAEVHAELVAVEERRRRAVLDVTHNHVRLLTDPRLLPEVLAALVASWELRGIADGACAERLRRSRARAAAFLCAGFAPLLAAAGGAAAGVGLWAAGCAWLAAAGAGLALAAAGGIAGAFLRKVWGRADLRRHYASMLASREYFGRALRGYAAEKLVRWLRAGRVSDARALAIAARPARLLGHLACAWLPAPVHRLLTDGAYAVERLKHFFVRPVRLYFNAKEREAWLFEMVDEGRRKHMLTEKDAAQIRAVAGEPFIQKYLQSLAVHLCTLPVTQTVAIMIAVVAGVACGWPWKEILIAAGVLLVLFQLTPISPGSLARGAYVVYLVLRERNFRDYNIALFLSFFKYVGYLAFPIQMASRYPALARFMAAHWATDAVHLIPVFGERGALLEHAVFGLCYNYPLTVRRRMREREERRAGRPARLWPAFAAGLGAAALLCAAEAVFQFRGGKALGELELWPLMMGLPLLAGSIATLGAGGAPLARRLAGALAGGAAMAALFAAGHTVLHAIAPAGGEALASAGVKALLWGVFLHPLFGALGVLATEVFMPERRRRR
ncbi:MAG TPA: hypothetical protein PKX48_10960 [Planctomycetota bacterium]|jgi:hypothetical protein|nr:hypothetical protein [Planctomycetota bacterium]OQC20658.1 MAG: hypothetical protein BWX69_01688 [Planctomycetes bacterium ADurb.Bin069]HNR98782.1 hypothetical protein [Planctomycetota bacterium]HNU25490.1 hypothetical protein [Planctomycetota bacterium]HOE30386.1 hypothetical protein [Planctomycetota bacterium]